MSRLISANISRLLKDKIFWICTVAMLLLSVGVMLNGCRQASMNGVEQETFLSEYYFNYAPVIGAFMAVFISLFTGTEYSDGTIRNKLTVGHTRTHIYLSNFIVCFGAGLVIMAGWLLGGLVGIPFLRTGDIGIGGYALLVLVAFFFVAALTGIFTMLGMLSSNKAYTAVMSIVLYLVLLVAASMVYNRLCEPEMMGGVVITEAGMQVGDPTANPAYLAGAARTLFEWILDFLPTGQGILMANVDTAHPVREIILSVLITCGTMAAGCRLFRRKDLK
jgi:ABC-2 type transport system permease protein